VSQPTAARTSRAATRLVQAFGRGDERLAATERVATVVALLAIVAIVFLQAVLRYLSGAFPLGEWLDPTRFVPPPETVLGPGEQVLLLLRKAASTTYDVIMRGGSEVCRYALVWAAALGASVGTRDHRHIAVDLVVRVIEQRGAVSVARWAHVLIGALATLIVAYLAYCGWVLYGSTPIQMRESAALRIPIRWVALALPLGLGVMAVRFLGGTVAGVLEALGLIDPSVRYRGGGGLQALLAEYGAKAQSAEARHPRAGAPEAPA
jgi:TRAP-type C4-dicarboxylate transport system permease small subunit